MRWISELRAEPDRVILLSGRRGPAIRGARELGYEPLSLDLRPGASKARAGVGLAPEGRGAVAAARRLLAGRKPAAVVAVTEAGTRIVAGLREALRVPGEGREVTRRCSDKLAMKRAASRAGVPVAPWEAVNCSTDAAGLIERLGLPVVIKLRQSSGGRGIVVARTQDEVADALRDAEGCIAEGWISGTEMSIESLVVDGSVCFQNFTQYLLPTWSNVVPARLSTATEIALSKLAARVHHALGVRTGMTHIEAFYGPDGVRFGEIALRPPGGMIMELISRAYGFNSWQAFLQTELGNRPEVRPRPARAAGVWFLHPGPGQIARVEGLEAAAAMPGVQEVRCRLTEGDLVSARHGSGESIGHVLVEGLIPQECAERLQAAHDRVRIQIKSDSIVGVDDGGLPSGTAAQATAADV